MKNKDNNSGWTPEFTLDLTSASGQRFQDLITAFEESTKSLGQLPPLKLENGWHSITPEIAEELLRRNRPGANRKAGISIIQYYAFQMRADEWKATGQPIVFTREGVLVDGQHRLWGCYLGLVTFTTYVVTDAPIIEDMFAYLDNGKARNASTALETAGLNGLSPLISKAVLVAFNFDAGLYTCHKKKRGVRIPPVHVLHFARENPQIKLAARLAAGEYKDADALIAHKDITTFVTFKIITIHDEEVCDRFMEDLAFPEDNLASDSPIKALRNFLEKEAKSKTPMAKHLVLAHVIKAFNAWIGGLSLKKVSVDVDDPFPQFVESSEKTSPEETEA